MQSQWHSTPTINGVDQKDGKEFKATNVHYKHTANGGVFDADIAGAYPKEALVNSWIRTFTFDRTLNTIEISEVYALSKVLKPFRLHFMTCLTPTPDPNKNQIVLKSVNTTLVMDYNSKEFEVEVDSHKTEDEKISSVWGVSVNRVTLVSKKKDLKGGHKITFHL